MDKVLELLESILAEDGVRYLQDRKNDTPTWVGLVSDEEITCEDEVVTSLESACDSAGLSITVDRDRRKAISAIWLRKLEAPSLDVLRGLV